MVKNKYCDTCIKKPCIVMEALPKFNRGCEFWVAKGKFVALLRAVRMAVGK